MEKDNLSLAFENKKELPLKDSNKKHFHYGHRERLRNIVLNTDASTLPEHQILELMLTFVLPQKDVNPLAHELLENFGSLANVLDAKPDILTKVKGVGEVVASFLNFCSKLPEIYNKSKSNSKVRLSTARDIIKHFMTSINITSIEKFYYMCLTASGDVLCLNSLGSGSISQLYVNNRELIQQILKYPTQSVVICHTHPNGKPAPSDADIKFTNYLKDILDSLSIRLCDHIIISSEGYYSFYQNNLLGFEISNRPFGDLKSTLLSNGQFVYASSKKDFPDFNQLKQN